jgi:hypothetical protein
MTLEQHIEEAKKRFDEKFGIDGLDKNSDSIGREAGCDDCVINIKLRGEHKSFFSTEIEKAYKAGLQKAIEVAENRKKNLVTDNNDNKICNPRCHDSGKEDALTTLQEELKKILL